MRRSLSITTLVTVAALALAFVQEQGTTSGLRAMVKPVSQHVPLGRPVWVHFTIENTTDEPVTLTVAKTQPQIPSPETGLPLSHVFGAAGGASAVSVTTDSGRRWDHPVSYRTGSEAPILMIAARSSVGTTIDLREYFPAFRGAGQYRINWHPYGGMARADQATINVSAPKQAEILTDDGTMTVRFYYDEAPLTVANFLDLTKSGIYNGLSFHRIEQGYFLQGGCPRGDGTGIRLDGKRIPLEPNKIQHEKGTLSMALLDDDPDSGSCQFFICNTRQKEWDGRYTVFGELVGDGSFETLDKLMSTPVDESGRPTKTLYIRSLRLIDAPSEPATSP